MRTVKQVSDLTGISVRMLHYYDEIGLLKPTLTTEAKYRLYDDEALETLQQILFFKELDIPLKEVKKLIDNPRFDRSKVLENQKKLLILKRNRLNDLIKLINRTIKGEREMSFKEFDMSEYFNVLEEFKKDEDKIIKVYGSMDKYDEMIEKIRSKEDEIADMAIKEYGSIEKYAKAVKQNLNSDLLILSEQYAAFKKELLDDTNLELARLFEKLSEDLRKDTSSKEIQVIADAITKTVKKDYKIFEDEIGDEHWFYMIKLFLINEEWIKDVDNKYGIGASKFIGQVLEINLGGKKPKIETLYDNLVLDLTKDPSSSEIQKIIEEIAYETDKSNKIYKIDQGENHWAYMSDLYLNNDIWIKVTDDKYGEGRSRFIGEAFKVYADKCKN
ncbi:MerR family transcriptional regulator [Clostridium intestinale]|uniref:DNA-binding transcriptional regulator, MerR family n=1 Tax=Clostridium intestinale DSM 6191 TaxID=1121320 RepID=A0A1M5UV64_9CLOT|nr:MerR family transcriptional regulator [Clostridium intestinale]SHH66780.1 DNA-binding transcriptional regulator, MerR family [Clostridium intestinale DSM 6191]